MARQSNQKRVTKETDITLALSLDGGEVAVATGIGFFDHMLTAFAFHGGFGLTLSATGDLKVDGHHTVEDVGITLGLAFGEALGDKRGIARFGASYVPMDEALARTVVDLSGRPYLVFDAVMPQEKIGTYESCLTVEFMRGFAQGGGVTLHQTALYGDNSHHITEALFKSLGRALAQAVALTGGGIASTKGVL